MVDSARILVVEDNKDLAFGLRTNLEVQGYRVTVATDGLSGLNMALDNTPDLIILDLMLPELNGIDVLKRIRKTDKATPKLILPAKGNEVDKVLGLRLGAGQF